MKTGAETLGEFFCLVGICIIIYLLEISSKIIGNFGVINFTVYPCRYVSFTAM